ncbi:hypothetical protein D2962_02520 [Biomaibacter acetigenes]|uniref:Uncharacterized protein n=1 Tax=Biomaibacter acetigenes TaxID=2316383 RepID=A0A3G2R3C5_9FIRM|nr:hypothetical protein D2962_02520 [Biomaibacter acetigenes]
MLRGLIKADQYHRFIIHPKKYPHKKQKTVIPALPMSGNVLFKMAAEAPAIPQASICHIVQGPWPKKKFDTSAAVAPTTKPALQPMTEPATMIIKVAAWMFGSAAKAMRPMAATVPRTAVRATSLEET